jgi:creatinine amidohydrolase
MSRSEVPAQGAWVAQLSWPQVQERIHTGTAALLPIGAASKEHGPHLPLHSDQLQAEWLTQALLQRFPLLAWPTVTYGYYPAFVHYPGSSHLQEHTFRALVDDVVSGILRHGIKQVFLLNTGISTIGPLTACAHKNTRLVLLNAYSGPQCTAACEAVIESGGDGHADERETSILLAIEPDQVAMDRAPENDQANIKATGPLQWHDPQAPNYSPSGIIGDAQRASADKGRRILDAMLQDLTNTIEQYLTTTNNRNNR